MLSHTRMGVPYEYTHMGRPIRVCMANIRIWGRTEPLDYVRYCWTESRAARPFFAADRAPKVRRKKGSGYARLSAGV